jgi:hypothetical protein
MKAGGEDRLPYSDSALLKKSAESLSIKDHTKKLERLFKHALQVTQTGTALRKQQFPDTGNRDNKTYQ